MTASITDHSLILVHTTCADAGAARALADRLVAERLAACASFGPGVTSVYPWAGRIETADEVALALKTTRARFAALAERLRALHAYEVPELLAIPVIEHDNDYANWIIEWVHSDTA
ncbi:MAG: divalent-cation tolerance protein CutA [Wenzhouxiangellaceae bacterium]|nr:divalent-cation tolerance protein CutA [Wenzhouxiangellaceae bacterium]